MANAGDQAGTADPGPGPRAMMLAQLRDYRASLAAARDALAQELNRSPLMVRLNELTDEIRQADAAIDVMTRRPGNPGGQGRRSGTLEWAREYVRQAGPGDDLNASDLATVFLARGWSQGSTTSLQQAAAKALGILCRDEQMIIRERFGHYRKNPEPPGVS